MEALEREQRCATSLVTWLVPSVSMEPTCASRACAAPAIRIDTSPTSGERQHGNGNRRFTGGRASPNTPGGGRNKSERCYPLSSHSGAPPFNNGQRQSNKSLFTS